MYLNVNIDAHTTHNPRYAIFSRRLAKVAQTTPKGAHPATPLSSPWRRIKVVSLQRAAMWDFFLNWLTVTYEYLQIPRKPQHRPRTWLYFRKANET